MEKIIKKLQDLYNYTNGEGISFPHMLRELADFREYDLPEMIERLSEIQQQLIKLKDSIVAEAGRE